MNDAESRISDEVGAVVESFLSRFRRGERPALTDLVARHPEMADQLLDIIPAIVEMERHGEEAGSMTPRLGAGSPAGADTPVSLGEYRIIRHVGGGGMGVVYEAEHASLRNRVALKVMHPRFRADEKSLRRFHVEARSAARLHHTNIVTVFDYGEQGGVCYYAMQYIRGQPLDAVLKDVRRLRAGADIPSGPTVAASPSDRGPEAGEAGTVARGLLTGRFERAGSGAVETDEGGPTVEVPNPEGQPAEAIEDAARSISLGPTSLSGPAEGRYFREVARIGAQVADALEYAHRAGVLHRDIKPSNLLLDATGNVWVTDFGLAKLVDGEDVSQSHDLVGTLRYMGPERFRGVSARASDIYALGATLYEFLTLRPAFEESDQLRLIDRIVHEPPARPRSVDRRVPLDLETIVLKALAKEPRDRFGSAGEMAEELGKFVGGRPIRSRRISWAERTARWCRRNPWLAAANVAAATTMTALAIGSTIAAKVYRDDREQISASEAEARRDLFDARSAQARANRYSGRVGQRFETLAAIEEAVRIGRELRLPAEHFDRLRDEAIAALMLPDLRPDGPAIELPEGQGFSAFDPGLTRYATRSNDGTMGVHHLADGREISRFVVRNAKWSWPDRFSADGRYLVTLDGEKVTVWDVARGERAWVQPASTGVRAFDFHPVSPRIAVALQDGPILVHDLATGEVRQWASLKNVSAIAYRPDGAEVAVVTTGPDTCRILDAGTGRLLRSYPSPGPSPIAWSPDGHTLAIQAEQNTASNAKITLVSAERGDRGAVLEMFRADGGTFSFHPSGNLLASDSWGGILRFWNPATGRLWFNLHSALGSSLGRDGRTFLGEGRSIRPWTVEPGTEFAVLRYPYSGPLGNMRPSVHPGGRILAGATDRGVVLWDLVRRVELGFLPIGYAVPSKFDPDGDLLTTGSAGTLRWPFRLDSASGEFRIGPPSRLALPGTECGLDCDRTGQIIAVPTHSRVHVLIDGRVVTVGPFNDCRTAPLSPDGRWLATALFAGSGVSVWALPEGRKVADLPINIWPTWAHFSPDGRWLVSISGRTTRFWEVGTWRESRSVEGELMCFSRDGRLAIIRRYRDVRLSGVLDLVEVETGRTLARIDRPDPAVPQRATFSPDGSRLIVTADDPPTAQVIDLRAIRGQLVRMGLDWDATGFAEADLASADRPPLSPLKVDYGHLASHLEIFRDDPETVRARHSERLASDPDDVESLRVRAHSLWLLNRAPEALEDLARAIRIRPGAGLFGLRARIRARARQYGPAIDDLEAALKLNPANIEYRDDLAQYANNLAWELASKRNPISAGLDRALELSGRAVELSPDQLTLNTRGLALFRAGRNDEAVATLDRSLAAGNGQNEAYDLFFLAMAHHRLGHEDQARSCLNRAVAWLGRHPPAQPAEADELAAFRAEAESVLAGPVGELPDDVFRRP